MIQIDCYLSPECGSEEALRANIGLATTRAGIQVELNVHRLEDERAIALGATGSPSVFINGRELQPQGVTGFT